MQLTAAPLRGSRQLMRTVGPPGIIMISRRLLIFVLAFGVSTYVAQGSSPVEFPDQPFDLRRPPPGWYRFERPFPRWAIWLPNDWLVIAPADDDDFRFPPFFIPKDELRSEISMGVEVYRDYALTSAPSLISDVGQFSGSNYTLHVGQYQIPCRSDPHRTGIRHICIVGPYSSERFYPRHQPVGLLDFRLGLDSSLERETELMPVWKSMVASFVLEQPPGVAQDSK